MRAAVPAPSVTLRSLLLALAVISLAGGAGVLTASQLAETAPAPRKAAPTAPPSPQITRMSTEAPSPGTATPQTAVPLGGTPTPDTAASTPPRQADTPAVASDGGHPADATSTFPSPVASYDIDATLIPDTHRLTGRARITFTNPGKVPAYSLRLHLYWNAFSDTGSSWLRQAALGGSDGAFPLDPQDAGWQQLTALRIVNPDGSAGPDLLGGLRFIQPDDQNADDRTLAAVDLPAAVAPGDTLRLDVEWHAQVPRTIARTGVRGRDYFIAHWFPKLGRFGAAGWEARQFFANTEFAADFGRYDVRLTVPDDWVVGATGTEVSRTPTGRGTTTHRYAQDGVHDFAWTTSPHYVEHRRRFTHPTLPAVEMRLLLQPEHAEQEDRHFDATAAALRYYGEWYGAYPYPQLTIVDPAWRSGFDGMEYPTIFTAGSRWLAPRGTSEPEGVTVHEAGHQFWFGLVSSHETDDAWMDEGVNTFSEARVGELTHQPDYRVERFFGGFVPWQMRDVAMSRASDYNGLDGYRRAGRGDVQATPSFRYWPGTHVATTYFKTALWLHTLERHVGWERLQPAMQRYFTQWRFGHPRPADFFAALNAGTGASLDWFIDQVYRTTAVFDYAVDHLTSAQVQTQGVRPAQLADEPAPVDRTSETYRTTVVVRRLGDGVFPVDVRVRFEDGTDVRERWDGRGAWQQFQYERPSRAVSAEVDPDRVLLLDVARTNNSRSLTPQADAAATHWARQWMVWLQDLLVQMAVLV